MAGFALWKPHDAMDGIIFWRDRWMNKMYVCTITSTQARITFSNKDGKKFSLHDKDVKKALLSLLLHYFAYFVQ